MDKLHLSSLVEKSSFGEWKMHNLVRVMAVKENDKSKAKRTVTEIPEVRKWKENLQKVFLTENKIRKIPNGISPQCSQLSTLLLDGNSKLELISDDFFIYMPTLRVLDLSHTNIKFCPHLSPTWGAWLHYYFHVDIPSLAKLQRLISLDLSHTAITNATFGLELLISLRHLNLKGTKQLKMSTLSVIPKLINMQSLYLNCIPESMDVRAQDLQGLKELEAISANFCDIKEFNAYVRSFFYRDRGPNVYSFTVKDEAYRNDCGLFLNCVDSLKSVTFEGMKLGNIAAILPQDIKQLVTFKCHGWTTLCHVLSFHKRNDPSKLDLFEISSCDKLKHLFCFSSICLFCSSVPLVNRLSLNNLKDLQNMVASPLAPSRHVCTLFSHLRDLTIDRCNSMKTLLTPELLAQLQNLQTLLVGNCELMKKIVSERSRKEYISEWLLPDSNIHCEHTINLPKLSCVCLANLPELNYVYTGIRLCPSILDLTIKNCRQLTLLPQIKKIPNGCTLLIKQTLEGYALEKIN